MHTEEWRAVAGYEGLYEVSDQGRVRSVDRVIASRKGNQRHKGKILRLGLNPVSGYQQIGLYLTGKKKTWGVHCLVARTFLPQEQGPYREVCHRDGVRTNNHASNLRWDTPSGNHKDMWVHRTMMHGESHTNHILTAEQVLAIRRSPARNGELAREFGVSPATICNILSRKTWRWLEEQTKPNGHPRC